MHAFLSDSAVVLLNSPNREAFIFAALRRHEFAEGVERDTISFDLYYLNRCGFIDRVDDHQGVRATTGEMYVVRGPCEVRDTPFVYGPCALAAPLLQDRVLLRRLTIDAFRLFVSLFTWVALISLELVFQETLLHHFTHVFPKDDAPIVGGTREECPHVVPPDAIDRAGVVI